MPEQYKDKITKILHALTDVKVLGQVAIAVIVLLVSWSGVKAIQTNYELQKDIAKLKQEVAIAELENKNLELQNQYLETEHFLELSVRQHFGKAANGEKIYLVPKDIAIKHAPKIEAQKAKKDKEDPKPTYQKNLEAWSNFFFRKGDNKLINES